MSSFAVSDSVPFVFGSYAEHLRADRAFVLNVTPANSRPSQQQAVRGAAQDLSRMSGQPRAKDGCER
jgi:hypothetical protein